MNPRMLIYDIFGANCSEISTKLINILNLYVAQHAILQLIVLSGRVVILYKN